MYLILELFLVLLFIHLFIYLNFYLFKFLALAKEHLDTIALRVQKKHEGSNIFCLPTTSCPPTQEINPDKNYILQSYFVVFSAPTSILILLRTACPLKHLINTNLAVVSCPLSTTKLRQPLSDNAPPPRARS